MRDVLVSTASMKCECGCGTELRTARWPSQQPRFVRNHHRPRLGAKLSDETKRKISEANIGDNPSYSAIHVWLLAKHPKTGVCEACGKEGRTDHAYKHHPRPYTRDRSDYEELCRSCHKTLYPQSPETRRKISEGMKRVRAEKFWSSRASDEPILRSSA